MSDSVKEQLSAFLDGELSEAEVALLAKRVAKDAELASALRRYALVGESLKGDRPAPASSSFAANVMAALDAEPAPVLGRAVDARKASDVWARRLRPVAGFAVAAGVAAVALITIQRPTIGPTVADNEAPIESTLAAVEEQPSYTVPTTTITSAFVPAARLTNYVVAHSEYTSPLGRRTVLSGVLAEEEGVQPTTVSDEPMIQTTVTEDASESAFTTR